MRRLGSVRKHVLPLVLTLLLLLAACEKLDRKAVEAEGAGGQGKRKGAPAAPAATPELDAKAAESIGRTAPDRPALERRHACIELGRLGGNAARDRLLEMLGENTKDPLRDGPTHLYAAAGLTILKDPGTAVPLLQALSTNNPNDNIAALASEERAEEYFTVDAQICDALLGLGLLEAEEELVAQMRRRHRIRVLIDAYAVLRRRTGQKLPFRYNGSYAARNADADAWQEWLRSTRAERAKHQPFRADDPTFRATFQKVVDDLGTDVMNNLLIARKIVLRVGPYAVPFLLRSLRSDNVTWQREGALMLGRIGARDAAPALREALALDNAAARTNAMDALRLIGDETAAPLAIARLQDPDAGVRTAAARFLGAFSGAGAEQALRAAIAVERLPDTRAAMEEALKK